MYIMTKSKDVNDENKLDIIVRKSKYIRTIDGIILYYETADEQVWLINTYHVRTNKMKNIT